MNYEYSLGSARESRGWYYRARHVLGSDVSCHRMDMLTEVIKMLLSIVPQERNACVLEEPSEYSTKSAVDADVPF